MDKAEASINNAKNNMIKLLLVTRILFPKCMTAGIAGNKNFLAKKTPKIEGKPNITNILKSTNFCFNRDTTPAMLLNPTMHKE
jgi:hypothetical protein